MIRSIHPTEAVRLIERENALPVDIRESEEFAAGHVKGARLQPLSVLPLLAPDPDRERPAVFYCGSGRRTRDSAAILEGRGFSAAYVIEGGLDGWKKAGLPVAGGSVPLPMPRQIQMVAGSLVVVFSLLGFFAPAFAWLTLLVGAGLIFAGSTGICLMAGLLARMPWNRRGQG